MRTRARAGELVVPPRTTAAPNRRPAEQVRRAARRRPKAAHTDSSLLTDAVFHAPMFALNAVAK
jgi:hypothetical protein